MNPPSKLLEQLRSGDMKALARAITMVENDLEGSDEILLGLSHTAGTPVLGITGPPGAGKSTLINGLIRKLTSEGKKIAVVAIDPTSPFNYGSLLADRLRMNEHFTNPLVFIRSLATRGSLGGLSEKIIEVTDVLREAGFDLVLVETVGVGQSEVEIAGLADTTVVVLVHESGDEVQTLKSGVMEIADIFVVNKSDREGAESLYHNLKKLVSHPGLGGWSVPVVKTAATWNEGIGNLLEAFRTHQRSGVSNEKKMYLLTEKAYRLIRQKRMKDVKKPELSARLALAAVRPDFNLYRFADQYLS